MSTSRTLDAHNATSTALLLQVSQAIQLAEDVPPPVGRRLVQLAKAARLYVAARELEAAARTIDTMLDTLPADEPTLAAARGVIERAAKRVHASIGFTSRQDAKADANLRGDSTSAAA
jgi:hypothetical protein